MLVQKARSILPANLEFAGIAESKVFYVFKWGVVETRPHSVAKSHLELGAILLSQPPM